MNGGRIAIRYLHRLYIQEYCLDEFFLFSEKIVVCTYVAHCSPRHSLLCTLHTAVGLPTDEEDGSEQKNRDDDGDEPFHQLAFLSPHLQNM